jgi:hypothetical protein
MRVGQREGAKFFSFNRLFVSSARLQDFLSQKEKRKQEPVDY